jgi:hypothetical protein
LNCFLIVVCFCLSDNVEEQSDLLVDDAQQTVKQDAVVADHFGDAVQEHKFLFEQPVLNVSVSLMNFMFSAWSFCPSVVCFSSVFGELISAPPSLRILSNLHHLEADSRHDFSIRFLKKFLIQNWELHHHLAR